MRPGANAGNELDAGDIHMAKPAPWEHCHSTSCKPEARATLNLSAPPRLRGSFLDFAPAIKHTKSPCVAVNARIENALCIVATFWWAH